MRPYLLGQLQQRAGRERVGGEQDVVQRALEVLAHIGELRAHATQGLSGRCDLQKCMLVHEGLEAHDRVTAARRPCTEGDTPRPMGLGQKSQEGRVILCM